MSEAMPAPARVPLVAVHDLQISFPQAGADAPPALRDVDLVIGQGELIGLVGDSGAGKTTLAKTIMASLSSTARIDSGSVSFKGNDMLRLDDGRKTVLLGRELSMIVANPRSELNPILTVGTQISNLLQHHFKLGRAAARERALDMLRSVNIPDPERRMDAYPHELSGGMAQRVLIAMALACSPDFVISDDATSGLDVTVQAQVLKLVWTLVRERDASCLFITRDIAIAAHYCTRIVIIYAGEVVETAPTARFFDHPAHPYSMVLLSAFAHNEALRRRWHAEESTLEEADCACRFAPRCVRRQPRCVSERPTLRTLEGGHQVRCHFPVEG